MTTLDRYIIKEFLIYFIISLCVFIGLFFLVDLLQKMVKYGPNLYLITHILYRVPEIGYQLMPIACLIGTVFCLSIMSRHSEVTAMFSCGFSLYRISLGILITIGIVALITFLINDNFAAIARQKSDYIYKVKVKNEPYRITFKRDKIWYRDKNSIYNIDSFNLQNNILEGVTIFHFDDNFGLIETIKAKQAFYQESHWVLKDGVVILYDNQGAPYLEKFETKNVVMLEKPDDLKEIEKDIESLSFKRLHHYIVKNEESGFDTTRHRVNLQAKISFIIICFVMSFLGVPFSLRGGKSGGRAADLGFCLILAFIYWVFFNICLSFGYKGTIPPLISAWLANIVFIGLGFYLIRKIPAVR